MVSVGVIHRHWFAGFIWIAFVFIGDPVGRVAWGIERPDVLTLVAQSDTLVVRVVVTVIACREAGVDAQACDKGSHLPGFSLDLLARPADADATDATCPQGSCSTRSDTRRAAQDLMAAKRRSQRPNKRPVLRRDNRLAPWTGS